VLVKLEAGVAVASAVGVAAETGNADLEAGVGEDHDLDPEVVTPERGQNDPGHDRGTEDLGQGQGEDQGALGVDPAVGPGNQGVVPGIKDDTARGQSHTAREVPARNARKTALGHHQKKRQTALQQRSQNNQDELVAIF